jgi:hypothetical protein
MNKKTWALPRVRQVDLRLVSQIRTPEELRKARELICRALKIVEQRGEAIEAAIELRTALDEIDAKLAAYE